MNKNLARLVAVVGVAGLLYYWFGDAEDTAEAPPPPVAATPVAVPPTAPAPAFRPPQDAARRAAPATPRGGYAFRGAPPGGTAAPGTPGHQAFRPTAPAAAPQPTAPLSGAAPAPAWPGAASGNPQFRGEAAPRPGPYRAQERVDPRFRPLEQRELSRRYQGGFQRMSTASDYLANPGSLEPFPVRLANP